MVEKAVIGIDLGTVNTCVATYDGDNVSIVQLNDGRITPSYVYYDPKSESIFCGSSAQNKNKSGVIYDAKRFIGRRFNDPMVQDLINNYSFTITNGVDNNIYFEVEHDFENVVKKPEEISAELLRYIKDQMKENIVEAVITVPAHFNNNQREQTKKAAEGAGITVLQLMNEPTAAALNYFHQDLTKNLRAMVFDLGGGTLDISIIDIKDDDIIVKTVAGCSDLGGRNFDQNVKDYFIEKLEENGNELSELQKKRLETTIVNLKKTLSFRETAEESIMAFNDDDDFDIQLDRTTFDQVNEDNYEKCLDVIERCLRENQIDKEEIDKVIMVGGSSRIVRIQDLLRDYFGDKLIHDLDPDESVARGAAIQAFTLSQKKQNDGNHSDILKDLWTEKLNIIDITPVTLGVGVIFQEMSTLIKRNTPLPITHTEKYKTVKDGQRKLVFEIFEGERACTKFNSFLGVLNINNLPNKPAGEVCVDVTFTIDADGILTVTGECENQTEKLTITLNKDNVENVEEANSDGMDSEEYDEKFLKFTLAKKRLYRTISHISSKDVKKFVSLLLKTQLEEKEDIGREIDTLMDINNEMGTALMKIWDEYESGE